MKLKASYGSSASPAIVAQVEGELEKVLRDGVPSLPPRHELIHSLDVRAPYLETLQGLVDWDRLRASKLRFVHRSHARVGARAACAICFTAMESRATKFAAHAILFSAA